MIQIGPNCSGPCETCRQNFTGCMAGHGDDEYEHVDAKWIECWKLEVEIAAMEASLEQAMFRKGADELRQSIAEANNRLKELRRE